MSTGWILEPLSITSAAGWWATSDDGLSFRPVACWVLVIVANEDMKALPPEKIIVGLHEDELFSIVGVEADGRRYYHETDFKVLGEELK